MRIGIDEVGRGCWAGPLLVVAVRPVKTLPLGLNDSKKLSKKRRKQLMLEVRATCDIGEGWVSPQEIDQHGLTIAMKLGVKRSLMKLRALVEEEIVIDGNINYCPAKYKNSTCVIKADSLHPIVSAASIYAKVRRDEYMEQIGLKYFSQYQFERHVGYGTEIHRLALEAYGPTKLHRLSFKPVKKAL